MRRQAQFIRFWQIGTALLLLGLALLPALPVLAHGGAEMTVEPAVVAPGGAFNVQGEGVEAGAPAFNGQRTEDRKGRLDGLRVPPREAAGGGW